MVKRQNPYIPLDYSNPRDLMPDYTSGFQIIQDAQKSSSSTKIPDTVDGKVLLVTEGTIRYKPVAYGVSDTNNGSGFLKAHGVYVRTLNELSIPDPYEIADKLTKTNNTLTAAEKAAYQIEFLNRIHLHPLVAPLKQEEKKPLVGEMITVYMPQSLKNTGEIIKGYYEIKTSNNSNFVNPSDEKVNKIIEEIKHPTQEPEITKKQDSEIPTPVSTAAPMETPAVEYTNAEVVAYTQFDQLWADEFVGRSANTKMSKVGCLTTCLAMVSNYLNKFDITPKQALEELKKEKAISDSGNISSYKLAGNALLIKVQSEKANVSIDEMRNFIINKLRNRQALILHVDYKKEDKSPGNDNIGDHFIMCYKIDKNGNFVCNDPILNGKSFVIKSKTLTSYRPINPVDPLSVYKIVKAISFVSDK